MSLRINTNTQALNGHRQMLKNDMAIAKSLEKLSSGLKINRAADNAAGLIVSEQLRAQLGGLKQGMDNTEQAIALVQTAEGALDEMNALLGKAKKLVLSSLSDATTDNDQKNANQSEFKNILDSLQRIATQTQYAQNNLLSGSFSGKTVQLGAFASQTVSITVSAVSIGANGLGLSAESIGSGTDAAGLNATLSVIEDAITKVSTIRGDLGALQANTLETALSSLRTSYENLRAAESTVRDVDFAEESANFTKSTILVQSATAMLAQANQLPQNVLRLLG
jgi:flagellin